MRLHFFFYISLLLFSCNDQKILNSNLKVDYNLNDFKITPSGGDLTECLYFTSNVRDSDNDELFHCECIKNDKLLKIKISNCVGNTVHKVLTIKTADSTFMSSMHVQPDFAGNYEVKAVSQELILNTNSSSVGDSLIGHIRFDGVGLTNYEGRSNISLSGDFTCKVKKQK